MANVLSEKRDGPLVLGAVKANVSIIPSTPYWRSLFPEPRLTHDRLAMERLVLASPR